ncbi:MAG: hypothetical protein ACRDRG_12965 [Pseudonocardiaceae bacterium]
MFSDAEGFVRSVIVRCIIVVGGRARVIVIDVEPPELRFGRRRESRFGVLYLSRATSLDPVSTVITCRCAMGCGVVAGRGERRGGAGGVYRCL